MNKIYISYRSTGISGRGNYEVSGSLDTDNIDGHALVDHDLFFTGPLEQPVESRNAVRELTKKLRVRINNKQTPSIHAQLAAAWLLPPPSRSLSKTWAPLSIQKDNYLLSRATVGSVARHNNTALLRIDVLTVANLFHPLSKHKEHCISLINRTRRLKRVWSMIHHLPTPLHAPLQQLLEGDDGPAMIQHEASLRAASGISTGGDLLFHIESMLGNIDDASTTEEAEEIWRSVQEEQLTQQLTKQGGTQVERIVQARLGHGAFRERVLEREPACRVTGVTAQNLLRVSHIWPWRYASNEERLDGDNGLMLTPNADHLFDRGFISFEDDGTLLISEQLDSDDLKRFGLKPGMNVGPFSGGQRRYLALHRSGGRGKPAVFQG